MKFLCRPQKCAHRMEVAWSHRPADHRNVPTALGESAEALTASCNGGGGWGILWKSFFQLVKCNSVSFLQSGHIYDQRKDESSIIYIGKIISIKILISKIHENLSRERTQYSHRFFQHFANPQLSFIDYCIDTGVNCFTFFLFFI